MQREGKAARDEMKGFRREMTDDESGQQGRLVSTRWCHPRWIYEVEPRIESANIVTHVFSLKERKEIALQARKREKKW